MPGAVVAGALRVVVDAVVLTPRVSGRVVAAVAGLSQSGR
jgi:hypothetical protein